MPIAIAVIMRNSETSSSSQLLQFGVFRPDDVSSIPDGDIGGYAYAGPEGYMLIGDGYH